ncbi:ABC transporter substrate-binding protein [Actinocrispum sp. NPDC049592]|uniref:ABC transporter substrate-binding protein n=1 Tax=Actinocrispum sp. NPDC049592 TaxID=3154835 RepID=UPI0034124626
MLRRASGSVRSRRAGRAVAAILGTAGILAAVSGCGLLGGSSNDSGGGGNGQLERTTLKIGAMPILDSAPVHIASLKGYFKDEGLDVTLEPVTGAATAIPKLLSGDLQLTYGAYVPVLQAQAKGTGDFKFVADSYQTADNIFVIMVKANSPIKSPKDLTGKTIATNTKNSITDLLAKSALDTAGVDSKTIKWVEFPFPDMGAKLQAGDIDAAVVLEPYVTLAQRSTGATSILDTSSGPTANFPISGYTTTAKFAQENPKTVEAVRRALTRASEEARNRTTVEDAVVKYAKIDKEVAALVRIGTYPTSLDRTRLQRTVDLMKKYDMLPKDVNVDSMIIDSAKTAK